MPTTEHAQSLILAAVAPDEQPLYFALFADLDAEVELEVPGYQRVEYLGGWITGGSARVNASPIEWAEFQAQVVVRAAGYFDAAVGGKLIGYSTTLTLQSEETEVVIEVGDICELPIGAVRLKI